MEEQAVEESAHMCIQMTQRILALGMIPIVIMGVFALFMLVVNWKVYVKGGQPGIASIIPIWQTIAFLQIAGKPWWWLLLMCIPLVNFVVAIIAIFAFAKSFGKGGGFGLGLLLLTPIFLIILAFGSATHSGAAEAPAA